ncbi:MAG: ribokinase [Clostridia bacterium]|nr:ribokinase [Clostridia bacterium]
MADIIVVGSLNMDLVVEAERAPEAGETLPGRRFGTAPGGKGANQAVAAARLGGRVAMVGRVGADAFGDALLEAARGDGVDVRGVARDPSEPTGVALIVVEASGDNRIVIVAGANGRVTADDVAASCRAGLWDGARVLLLQLEIPLPAVAAAAEEGRRRGMLVLLDPAPAPPSPDALPPELWRAVDAVLPNQAEARALTGIAVDGPDAARAAAAALCARGPRTAVVKLGADGAFVRHDGAAWHEPGLRVPVRDTTAAGDAFAGALAVALAAGRDWRAAVAWANRAGAASATRPGAQPSLPTQADLERLFSA